MKKELVFLILIGLVASANYQLCNVTHIQFFTNIKSPELKIVNYGSEFIGQVILANYSNDDLILNDKKLENTVTPIIAADSFRYFNLSGDEKVFFNGHAGYYIKVFDGCSEDLYRSTQITYNQTPYFRGRIEDLRRYNLVDNIYFIQSIQLDGQIIQMEEINSSKLMNQISTCDKNFEEIQYLGTSIFTTKDLMCRHAYVLSKDKTLNEIGKLETYPGSRFFSLYELVKYIEQENIKLDKLDKSIPKWGNATNKLSNCSNDTLEELSSQMDLISNLQSNLTDAQQNIAAIISKDYVYQAAIRGINTSEIIYSHLPQFIAEQNSLELKSEQISNKLKLAQDSHRDLIAICVQSRTFDAQREESKTSDLFQWIAIILAITSPFSIYFLEKTHKKKIPQITSPESIEKILSVVIITLILIAVPTIIIIPPIVWTAMAILSCFFLIYLILIPFIITRSTWWNKLIRNMFGTQILNIFVIISFLVILVLLLWICFGLVGLIKIEGDSIKLLGWGLVLCISTIFISVVIGVNEIILDSLPVIPSEETTIGKILNNWKKQAKFQPLKRVKKH